MDKHGNIALWAIPVGIVVLVLLALVFIGIPRYELEDDIRLMAVSEDASFQYPVPIPGNATLCAGNVTVMQGEPVSVADGMSYTLFASGTGECAYRTQVRVLRWRRLFG